MRKRSSMYGIGERTNIQIVAQGSDVWYGTDSSIAVPPSGGEQMEVVCANAADISGGIGIQEVEIHYLDGEGVTQTETLTTNGGTLSTLATDMKFIQDIHASKVGNNGVAVGNISIRSKNEVGNPIYNMILAGGNMSLTINKMVPAGKTLYITHWDASAGGKQAVTIRLRSTDHHGELYGGNGVNPVFLFKDTVNLENSSFVRRWVEEEWFPIPEFSIVKISVWCPDQAGADVAVGWTGVLIDNE